MLKLYICLASSTRILRRVSQLLPQTSERRGFTALEWLGRVGSMQNLMNFDKEQNGSVSAWALRDFYFSCHILESPVAANGCVYIWFSYSCSLFSFPWRCLLMFASFCRIPPLEFDVLVLPPSFVRKLNQGRGNLPINTCNRWATFTGKCYVLTLLHS